MGLGLSLIRGNNSSRPSFAEPAIPQPHPQELVTAGGKEVA